MTLLALLALVASVLIWAAPRSQAQGNQAPFADAGTDQTLNPGAEVDLDGTGSIDVDDDGSSDPIAGCGGCEFEWEIDTGPYDWITIDNDDNAETATFNVPSAAFVDKVSDSDPQKYEIVVRLTVTDEDGATDSDTMSININQRPVADIQIYAGLRDDDIVDGDLGARGHFPDDAVIDGPGENGNRDNEWDVMEGAYVQLSGAGSTDEGPSGRPSAYQWTRVRPATLLGYAAGEDTPSTDPTLDVAIALSDSANVEDINFGDLDGDGTANEAGNPTATPPQIAETISVAKLPDVEPNAPQTVFYQLTVCDSRVAAIANLATATNCDGQTGSTLIRIVVHDTSATPEVSIDAGLTSASTARGDAEPQETVGAITGVENQFIVAAGSTVRLTANVEDADQTDGGHTFRWSGAAATAGTNMATVRVPADAANGDTLDVSVTTTDDTRISVTTDIQLLVGENTPPTVGGVPSNGEGANSGIPGVIGRSSYTDGIQSQKDGATVTLRGVGNDADGDSLIHAWVLRDAPEGFGTTIATALGALAAATDDAARFAALGPVIGGLGELEEPENPLFELNGAFTDTVSFDVPELENGETKSTVLIFTVIDSKGVSASQLTYIEIVGDDDAPNADAGDNEQVDPGSFVRLNGSDSADPDVGDTITYKWVYTGATMDPAPDERSPLSASEIDELHGWILEKAADGTFEYIVNAAGDLTGASDKLQGATTAYPYFDTPDLTGFNNIKLTFTLHVKDSPPTNIDGADAVNGSVGSLDEANVGVDLNGDGDTEDTGITEVNEVDLGLDLNDDGDAEDTVDLGTNSADEANVAAVDSDTVTITIVNRYFSGNIPGPDHCIGQSLGGPTTYPFDSDDDGVADTCSLNTTRRATVARQNALETLANLNPNEFSAAVVAACNRPGFKQTNYGDDPADLESDVCETNRVTPPPADVDPAIADVFYSGTITGPDFCTNHSLGGARTYAHDSDGDDVADQCSLATTRREAIARQNGLNSFIVTFTGADALAGLNRLIELSDGITANPATTVGELLTEYSTLYNTHVDSTVDDHTTALTADEQAAAETSIEGHEDVQSRANRYSNAVDAACRALGSQDFGDAASALARDACAPKPGPTGTPLS